MRVFVKNIKGEALMPYRVDKLKEFYLKYPDVFLENYFDIELLEYQKLFIGLIVRDKNNKKCTIYGRRI